MEQLVITGWTDDGNPSFEDIDDALIDYDYEELRKLIVDEVRKRGYKFNGGYHQYGDYGVPIINGKYTVMYSQRMWGGIIAEAHGIDPGDPYAYVHWAWAIPDGEEAVYPSADDYKC